MVGKLLRLRDYILLSAAVVGDTFEEVRLVGGFLPAAMETRYGFVPSKYKRSSYLTEVSQLLSVGDIERKTDSNGRSNLIITSKGEVKFKRQFKAFFESKSWDSNFMVAIFDIPEKRRKTRNSIRRKLIELGFGMLQKSVWISPYHFEEDLREFFEASNLSDNVFLLTTRKILAGDIQRLVEKVWKLKKINDGYSKVIDLVGRNAKDDAKALYNYLYNNPNYERIGYNGFQHIFVKTK